MALKKSIETHIGLPAEYHKIRNFLISERDQTNKNYVATVTVGSYLNEEARNNGAMAIRETTYTMHFSLFELENTPIIKLLYSKLKVIAEFEDSVDLL